MSQPAVSIIVPVYNAEKYLERCVNSLTNQTLKDIEILLVDDSSKDASLAVCNQLAQKDARIKVLHKVNEGAGKARNAALEIATGTYVGFVDADDYIAPDMFETLLEKAKAYASDLVMSGVLFVDGNMFSEAGECVRKTYFENDTHFDTTESLQELKMGIVGSKPEDADDSKYGMSIWKNLFKNEIIRQNNIRFMSEREMLSEDAVFMIDYISNIKKATGISEAFYNYCRNEDSISKSYKKDRFEKSLVFVEEVTKRFEKDIPKEEYQIYIDRFWQAMCRVLCVQTIMYAYDNRMNRTELKKQLAKICTHDLTIRTLQTYPISRLPFGQKVFAYGMKYKMYFVLKLLVRLRSK